MLRFSDFAHLPEVDRILVELRRHTRGLLLVAGPDARPASQQQAGKMGHHFLPSGRQTFFRILVSELLEEQPQRRAVVISEDRDTLHLARQFKRRLTTVHVKPPLSVAQALLGAAGDADDLIVLDRLTPETAADVLAVAASGRPIITQLDTVYHGARVAQQLLDMGAPPESLAALRWVITVQRLPMLCPTCRRAAALSADQQARLAVLDARHRALALPGPQDGAFTAPGCPACNGAGRVGDVALFDLFHATHPLPDLLEADSRLSLESSIWLLARRGELDIIDSLDFEQAQLRRVYNLLASSENRATDAARSLQRKVAQLETANRVLEQRTRELVTLESVSQSLLSGLDLARLGARLIQSVMELCKADRAVLYYVRSADWAQVLAAHGWPGATVGTGLTRELVYANASDRERRDYLGQPPGLEARADLAPARCGMAVPLVADNIPAGLMIVQSTRKQRFTPGELALMEAMAGHAAVAMQRASLIEQLQGKIAALEAAQIELAQKERLERELELARELQLSMIPTSFPAAPGVTFGACYAPARQVGGDFYDVLTLPDGYLGLVIADVADKGMPAALYMTLVRTLLRATAAQSPSPADVLRQVNSQLIQVSRRDMFVTLFYGVLYPGVRRLVYTCAGHERPWLVRDGQLHPLDGRGMVLGLFEEAAGYLTEEAVALQSGDRLVLYTDGLTDIADNRGQMLGRDRLGELVRQLAPLPPGRFCEALFAELADHQGRAEQFDDMALLVAGIS